MTKSGELNLKTEPTPELKAGWGPLNGSHAGHSEPVDHYFVVSTVLNQ